MIYNLELEHRLLAGLLKHPDQYGAIADFISEKDFASTEENITGTVYIALKSFCENNKGVDLIVLMFLLLPVFYLYFFEIL